MHNVSLQQKFNRIPLLMYRNSGLFPADYVPTLDNDTFGITNTQPSKIKGEDWIMTANSRHNLYFLDFLEWTSFLKQQYKQMMPELLQSNPSVCDFYEIYAVFHLFKFRQEEVTGVHDVNGLSFLSNYK